MTIVIRPARPTDAGAVGAILSEFVDSTTWMPRLHTRAEDIAHAGAMIDRGWVTVAEGPNGIEGFAACHNGDVNALYVAVQARAKGVGSKLMQNLKNGNQTLDLHTFQINSGARKFYQHHGFIEVGHTDGDNEEGLPDVQLRWQREDR